MPIFEYSCTKCGHRFEKFQKNATGLKPFCPECGSWETKKELSAFSSPTGSSTSGAACYSGG
jgi:putative FmdB family regulatory protein